MMADDFGGPIRDHEAEKCDRIANTFLEAVEKWEELFTMVKNRGDLIIYTWLEFDNYSDPKEALLHMYEYRPATFLDEIRHNGRIEKPGTRFFPAGKGRGWVCDRGDEQEPLKLVFSPEKTAEILNVIRNWKEIKADKTASLSEERARQERWNKLNSAYRMLG
jgi:hypothetical protein